MVLHYYIITITDKSQGNKINYDSQEIPGSVATHLLQVRSQN